MRLLGHGVDIVKIDRIRQMLDEHADRFLERCFTPAEQAYCAGRKNQAQHLAARFAAKEAVLKALGKGLTDGIAWTDIEVTREATGQPRVVLRGKAAEHANVLGITSLLVSLSHTDTDAIASVIAAGD